MAEEVVKPQQEAKPQPKQELSDREKAANAIVNAFDFMTRLKPGQELMERMMKDKIITGEQYRNAMGYAMALVGQIGLFNKPEKPAAAAKPAEKQIEKKVV